MDINEESSSENSITVAEKMIGVAKELKKNVAL